jgi:hypothetical protein
MMAGASSFCAEGNIKTAQQQVLKRYGFAAPPDLAAFGLKKKAGVYVKKNDRAATEKELTAALEAFRDRGGMGKTKLPGRASAAADWALAKTGPDFDHEKKPGPGQQDIVQMADSEDPKVRAKAIATLGAMKKASLAPLFMSKMNDPQGEVRDAAAEAIGGILALYKKETQDDDWVPYMKAAPPLFAALTLSPDQADTARAARKVLYENISYGNRISDPDVTRMVRGMHDPRVLMIMMGVSDVSRVSQWNGMHSTDGVAYYTRIKTLTGGRVSRMFTDPAIKTMTKIVVLARLVNFRQMEDALRSDPGMNRVLPELLFEPEGLRNNWIRSNEIWTIDDIARRVYGRGFYQSIIDRLPSLSDGGRTAALAFLNAHPTRLSAAQRAAVASSTAKQTKHGTTVYSKWPKDGLDVAVFKTKSLTYVDSMLKNLDKSGYRIKSDRRVKSGKFPIRKLELIRPGSPMIRVHMEIFDSNEENEWWVLDKDGLEKAIAQAMGDPTIQAVIFRGHAGDFDPFKIGEVKASDKMFIDLSCYSDFRSEIAIRSCSNCDYFGTVGTSNGWNNDYLLPMLISDLADKKDPEEMLEGYERLLPEGEYYLSGSATRAGRWQKGR